MAGKAIDAGRDFLGHWNSLQRNTTQSSALESSSTGCCIESGLGGGEDQRQQDTLGTLVSKGV